MWLSANRKYILVLTTEWLAAESVASTDSRRAKKSLNAHYVCHWQT